MESPFTADMPSQALDEHLNAAISNAQRQAVAAEYQTRGPTNVTSKFRTDSNTNQESSTVNNWDKQEEPDISLLKSLRNQLNSIVVNGGDRDQIRQ